jgi:nitrogen regulatory protein P-II 2
VKIDVAIADDQLDEVIDVISKAAYTGKIGDGKIFVAELQRASFASVPAKPTKRHCNTWHTVRGWVKKQQ